MLRRVEHHHDNMQALVLTPKKISIIWISVLMNIHMKTDFKSFTLWYVLCLKFEWMIQRFAVKEQVQIVKLMQ